MKTYPTPTLTAHFMETAVDAGLKLVRDAIWDDDRCNWVGANVAPVGGQYQVVRNSCQSSVYNGLSGIALFLGHLSNQVREPLLDITFEGTMNSLLAMRDLDKGSQFAYFSGKLGVADVLVTLGNLKNRPEWTRLGHNMLKQICKSNPREDEIDIISGVAGGIPTLLKHYRETQDAALLQAAKRCGNFLLSKAVKTPQHWSWISMVGSPALTGYSHGNAGIALALLELYHATKEQQWYAAAIMGFQYERILFDAKMQNWPDLRQRTGSPAQGHTCAEAWCHGAPGIALSRLRAWQITGDHSFLAEARTALDTTRKGIFHSQGNYSLCHGTAGNADVLLAAGELLGDGMLVQAAQEAGRMGIERYSMHNIHWPSGVSDPNGGAGIYENPSLMTGLAGTGYFYLRLAQPGRVPTMLLLTGE